LALLYFEASSQLHGVFVWSLIPQKWRYWWFSYMMEKQASLSSVITMDDPKP
jgi:hypothetical protein